MPALLVCTAIGCGNVSSHEPDARAADAPEEPDVLPADAPAPLTCDPTSPFGAPVELAVKDGDSAGGGAHLTPDELAIYFQLSDAWGADIFSAQRASPADPFTGAAKLAGVSSAAVDAPGSISADGLTLYVMSTRDPGGSHIYAATRSSTVVDFGAPSLVSGVSSGVVTDNDGAPYLSADGTELWFVSNRAGGAGGDDVYRATRVGASFANPTRIAELATAANDSLPVLSADKLTIYFASDRAGGMGGYDIYAAHRGVATDGFPAPAPVAELNSAMEDAPTWISADNCRLYIQSDRSFGYRVFVATRPPM